MADNTRASAIGNIKEFNLNTDTWKSYIKRVRAFFMVNDIKVEVQTSYLITLVGNETYDLMTVLCSPEEPEKKTFDALVDIVENHVNPKASDMAERMKLRACLQNQSETVSEYLLRLKKLAMTCKFKGQESLEENLRDQFTYGLRCEKYRQRLLTERELSFTRAVTLATSLEAAELEAKLGGSKSSGTGEASHGGVYAVRGGGGAGSARGGRAGARGAGGGGGAGAQRAGASSSGSGDRCYRCGSRQHSSDKCGYKSATCYKCDKVGHISHMCRNKRGQSRLYQVDGSESEEDIKSPTLYRLGDSEESDGPWYCKLNVEGVMLDMQVDSGSSVSAISKNTYNKLYKDRPLIESDKVLTVYSGEKIKPVGILPVNVVNDDQLFTSKLYVIDNGDCPPILGRKWMRELQISLPIVANISCDEGNIIMNEIMCKYKNVFEPGIGTFNRGTISLNVCADAVPVWRRARVVPHALRPAVDAELARLQAESIISPVEDVGGWGTPIVPVKKQSGEIRICGDFKVTVNPVLCDDKYPLPRIEDLFSALRGGQTFSKIDLKSAYQQFLLDEESKKLCTIVTHKGNFVYNRLPFGIKTASNKFQRIMDSLFKLPHVTVFVDDLIITGETGQEHKENLDKVFKILNECGLRISKEKCCFFKKQVSYLGHLIDAEGLHTETKKVDAVLAAERPSNVGELRAFLGLINYYSKFVKNFSTIIAPLYALLKKNKKWQWSEECETGFLKIKELLKKSDVLVHFNPELPLVLSCDASPRGVGAWLGHEMPDGRVRAVAHASRTLSPAEQNYSQICREGLAIIFGVQRFHEYVYGRHFILVSDCKPLCSIIGPKTGIPLMMAGRLQRWSIILSEYNYSIKCVKSEENCVADCLSRAATIKLDKALKDVSRSSREKKINESMVNFIDAPKAVDYKDIAEQTKKDITLNKIFGYVLHGWPAGKDIPNECKDFYNRKDYITSEHGCLLFGYRVIIPNNLRSITLKQLHSSHLGIVKMKSLARTYIYWPSIDKDIEQLCGSCVVCAKERDDPVKSTLVPWSWPTKPWYRLHLDHLGPFANSHYLVIIDAHSKWIEACKVSSTNAEVTIKQLRDIFARFGLPNEVVTDNGPAFISDKFSEFMSKNGIDHKLIPPRHARSNGAAEKAVGLVKKCLKKAAHEGTAVDIAISRFLLNYRNSIQSTTQKTPSEMLLGRRLRSCLDLLRPCTRSVVIDKQCKQKNTFRGKQRDIRVGDLVMFKKWRNNKEIWEKGEVINRMGKVMYEIQYENEKHRRHIDQIFKFPAEKFDPIFDEGDTGETESLSSASSGHIGSGRVTSTPSSTLQHKASLSSPYEEAQSASDLSQEFMSSPADQNLGSDLEYDFVNTRPRGGNMNTSF